MILSSYESLNPSSEMLDNQPGYDYANQASPKEGKGNSLWKKVKYPLVEYHSLPGYLRDNEYIHGHYRAEWPLKQVFLSIFKIHNETLNVWTHLLGFFLFLFLTIYTTMKVPDVVDLQSLQNLPEMLRKANFHKIQLDLLKCLPSLPSMPDLKASLPSVDFLESLLDWNIREVLANCMPDRFNRTHQDGILLQDATSDVMNMLVGPTFRPITRWPFFAFMGGAMFCLLASSACHLLSCHSQWVSYIVHRLDYAGISALIATSFYPPVYYSFMCKPFLFNLYLGFITLLGIATTIISLLPVFDRPKFRSFRTSFFFGMGLSGVAPVVHKLILHKDHPEALQTTGYEILMGVFYGVGAVIYATRIPERWRPGKFDIAGSSHQLFHLFVLAGAYTHYQAGLVYLRWRDLNGC